VDGVRVSAAGDGGRALVAALSALPATLRRAIVLLACQLSQERHDGTRQSLLRAGAKAERE
jgi:hypothetical protein